MQQDRYCRNCGQELKPEDQFCAGCGSAVHATAHVPTPEADMPVPPPPQTVGDVPRPSLQEQQQPSEAQRAPWGPVWVMGVVFLILVTVGAAQGTVQGMFVAAFLLLLLGGGYYVTARKDGVTFREAFFNWPLVLVTGVVGFWYLL